MSFEITTGPIRYSVIIPHKDIPDLLDRWSGMVFFLTRRGGRTM